jgi:hypothetical protein
MTRSLKIKTSKRVGEHSNKAKRREGEESTARFPQIHVWVERVYELDQIVVLRFGQAGRHGRSRYEGVRQQDEKRKTKHKRRKTRVVSAAPQKTSRGSGFEGLFEISYLVDILQQQYLQAIITHREFLGGGRFSFFFFSFLFFGCCFRKGWRAIAQ